MGVATSSLEDAQADEEVLLASAQRSDAKPSRTACSPSEAIVQRALTRVRRVCCGRWRWLLLALLLSLALTALTGFHLRHEQRRARRARAIGRLEELGIEECRHLFPSPLPASPSAPAPADVVLSSTAPAVLPSDASVLAPSLSVLVVNGHDGVANELRFVLAMVARLTNSSVSVTLHAGYGAHHVPGDRADAWMAAHREHCEGQYDVIIFGDTIALSRPYLQGRCPAAMVLYVSNRYDYALHDDAAWPRLLADAVTWPRVRVAQNNLAEQWYATRFRNADLRVFDYIPSSGGISPLQCDIYADAGTELPPANDATLYVLNKLHAERLLIQPLQVLGIQLPVLPGHYGGQLALANRLVVHAPYQTNTMTLFEALRVNVTFLLPSLPLFRAWMDAGLATIGDKTSSSFFTSADLSVADMRSVVDWYRPELAHLFHFFDCLEDLRPGAVFRERVALEAPQHREHVWRFMQQHVHNVSVQWVAIVAAALRGARQLSSTEGQEGHAADGGAGGSAHR